MSEINNETKRTDYCGTLRIGDAGRMITVCGWVARRRDLGGLIFIDVRDRSGVLQCVFDDENGGLTELASSLRAEFVVSVTGVLRERASKNPKMDTGDVELFAKSMTVFSQADTPPFEILDEVNANDALRLKYRYLDLRRMPMQRALAMRHRVAKIARDYFDGEGFLEIETPMLTKSTPEGARDYLVPSRVHQGEFYALPQSPQQYKQLLMLSGFDRYFQIARCFRDEDLRADRQPEFTQIDLEMSFVDENDVMDVNERFLQRLFREVKGIEIELPLPRMPWREAMERFGSDKPDVRFGLEIKDASDILAESALPPFAAAAAKGGVRMINAKGMAGSIPRKQIDALGEFVKTYRAKGLSWIRLQNGAVSCSFAKYTNDEELARIKERAEAEDGDIVFIVADTDRLLALTALGALRCEIAKRMNLIDKSKYALLWVTEFPLFEYSEEEGRLVAMHHPFTAPFDDDLPMLETDPANVRAKAYDIVLNGVELGGGSIRIHRSDVQERMFRALGFSHEDTLDRFGHLIEAFRYGAPPHGGLAYGLDRVCMLLGGCDSIRDVIAFPKVQNASDLMMDCPSVVDKKQLDDLAIEVSKKED